MSKTKKTYKVEMAWIVYQEAKKAQAEAWEAYAAAYEAVVKEAENDNKRAVMAADKKRRR